MQQILPMFPEDLPVPIVIVQHMPVGFTGPFAHRLNNLCKITVREAAHEEPLQAGFAYIAPAGQHLTVARRGHKVMTRISAEPSKSLHIPSVDVMMLSIAEVFRALAMGIIMSGKTVRASSMTSATIVMPFRSPRLSVSRLEASLYRG